ncbi:MAG TPA: zinc-dependent dehydrogenase [Nakamurella sp.]
MRAAVFHRPGTVVLEDRPIPAVGPGDLLIRVHAASVCGTDLRIFNYGHFKLAPGEHRVQGHETAGEIVAAGKDVTGYAVGDRVAVTPNVGCGRCAMCRRGLNNMCPDYEAFGVSLDGGFQEYLLVPAFAVQRGNVFALPAGLSYAEAALVEPFSCCLRGVESVAVGPQDDVLVVGAGPIGAFTVMLAKLAGARRVIVANRSRGRLERLARYGADTLLEVGDRDLVEAVKDETGGRGVDVAITAASSPQVQADAVQLLATHGRLNFFAGLSGTNGVPTVPIDTNRVHYQGLTLTGTTGSSNADYERALRIVGERRVDLSGLLTRTFSIEDITDAFAYAASGPGMKAGIAFGTDPSARAAELEQAGALA